MSQRKQPGGASQRKQTAAVAQAKAWALRTKVVIAVIAGGVFVGAALAVPNTARGHTKRPTRPLSAPADFIQVLKSDVASADARVLPAAAVATPSSSTS